MKPPTKLFLAFLLTTQAWCQTSGNPPNIIMIMTDDMGYETLAVNGADEYLTPNLDRLAAEGLRFTNAFSNPVCTPSRVKLMTGKSNIRNYTGFGRLDRAEKTFAHALKDAGYATVIAGKWQLGSAADAPQHFGFDQALLWQHTRPRTKAGTSYDSRYSQPWFELNGVEVEYGEGYYGPDVLSDFLCDFIEANKDGPFLAYYPMLLTHCPFVPTPDSPDWDPTSPGSPTYVGDTQYFDDMMAYTDKTVQKIIDCLVANDLMDNTIVFFIGDNGTDTPVTTLWNGQSIRGGKRQMNDRGQRVPFIAYGPGLLQSGVVSDELIDLADFLPTFCEAAGIPIPEENLPTDGVSFWDTLQGIPGRDKPWSYIYYPESGRKISARNKTHMLLRPKVSEPERYEFYDAGERYNLNLLDTGNLSAGELAIYQELLGVIEFYDNGGFPPMSLGRIEAEDYSGKNGFAELSTESASGGVTMGQPDSGGTLDYYVEVPSEGSYEASFGVAADSNNIAFDLMANDTVLWSVDVAPTGDGATFKTIAGTINLPAGSYNLRIQSRGTNWNVDWLDISPTGMLVDFSASPENGEIPLEVDFDAGASTSDNAAIISYEWDFEDDGTVDAAGVTTSHTYLVPGTYTARLTITTDDGSQASSTTPILAVGQTPYGNGGAPWPIPGRIEVENFDVGGEGYAYHDTSSGNTGGVYRNGEEVDIQNVSDASGSYNVGDIDVGEWLEYSVRVNQPGSYELTSRYASELSGGSFRILVDGIDVTGTLSLPPTGGAQTWVDIVSSGFELSAGEHVVRLEALSDGFNLNWIEFKPVPENFSSFTANYPQLFGDDTRPEADPDLDGTPNVIEQWFGWDPSVPNQPGNGQPGASGYRMITDNSSLYFELVYEHATRNSSIEVLESTTLGGWSPVTVDPAWVSDSGSSRSIRVPAPLGADKSFYRVSAAMGDNYSASGNLVPTTSFTIPVADSAEFASGSAVSFVAAASDPDGEVASVALYQDGVLLGTQTEKPYQFTTAALAEGNYSFEAIAIDNQGASSDPATRNVTVTAIIRASIGIVGSTSAGNGGEFADYTVLGDGAAWSDTVKQVGSVRLAVSRTGFNGDTSPTVWRQSSHLGANTEIVTTRGSTGATDASSALAQNTFIAIKLDSPDVAGDSLALENVSLSLWRNGDSSPDGYQLAYDRENDGYQIDDFIGSPTINTGASPASAFVVDGALTDTISSETQEVRLYFWKADGSGSVVGNTHLYNVSVDYRTQAN